MVQGKNDGFYLFIEIKLFNLREGMDDAKFENFWSFFFFLANLKLSFNDLLFDYCYVSEGQ